MPDNVFKSFKRKQHKSSPIWKQDSIGFYELQIISAAHSEKKLQIFRKNPENRQKQAYTGIFLRKNENGTSEITPGWDVSPVCRLRFSGGFFFFFVSLFLRFCCLNGILSVLFIRIDRCMPVCTDNIEQNGRKKWVKVLKRN